MTYGHSKRASATKSGPGRYHQQGAQKASPIKDKGAPRGFVLHQASQAKRDRRQMIALYGRRHLLRMEKEFRAQHKADNDQRNDAMSNRHYEQAEAA